MGLCLLGGRQAYVLGGPCTTRTAGEMGHAGDHENTFPIISTTRSWRDWHLSAPSPALRKRRKAYCWRVSGNLPPPSRCARDRPQRARGATPGHIRCACARRASVRRARLHGTQSQTRRLLQDMTTVRPIPGSVVYFFASSVPACLVLSISVPSFGFTTRWRRPSRYRLQAAC